MATTKKTGSAVKKSPAKSSTKKSGIKNTPALSSLVDNNSSVSINEIENGFLVSESGYTGKGKNQQWYNKQYFSPTNPLSGVGAGKISFGKKK